MLVYTDGGCSGNPGPGGWAFIIADDNGQNIIHENFGAEILTTNNRMELLAVISALETLDSKTPIGEIKVFTDSQYVQKGMTVWIKDWKARGWKTSGKVPVKNCDLWQRLDNLSKDLPVTWHWVKGHAGFILNERCDSLTQKAIKNIITQNTDS